MTFQFETWSELLAMGGHGAFVWSAYSLAFIVLLAAWLLPYVQYKKRLNALMSEHHTQPSTPKDRHDRASHNTDS